ncbi:MAG: phage portal protein, partial [Clostridia bacterium]|nr:phage portal protein [Clostridia bacterium]
KFSATDIKIEANVDIPMDIAARVNEVVQLSGIVSHRTRLERLPFIENPDAEMERFTQEQQKSQSLELQKVNAAFYGAGVTDNE